MNDATKSTRISADLGALHFLHMPTYFQFDGGTPSFGSTAPKSRSTATKLELESESPPLPPFVRCIKLDSRTTSPEFAIEFEPDVNMICDYNALEGIE
jgi:hypothetical protein